VKDNLLERKLKMRVDADEKMLAAKQAAGREWKLLMEPISKPTPWFALPPTAIVSWDASFGKEEK
jgi:hypothetical protein